MRGRVVVERIWSEEGAGLLPALLAPAELAYRAALRVRNAAYDRGWRRVERAPVPVVSVGNLTVGGSGKTPFTAWLAGRLRGMGLRPAVVLRGYGGDETLLHRELNPGVPVFVARRRPAGARRAAAEGCDVVLLDDGFQHRALYRELDLVLIAADSWSGAVRLLPRGRWREPLEALGRADAAVVVRKTANRSNADAAAARVAECHPRLPLLTCRIRPRRFFSLFPERADLPPPVFAHQPVLAVAGIADPRPLVRHLEEAGASPELLPFPDHHRYTQRDAREIVQKAKGRVVITTSKDAVKLGSLLPPHLAVFVLRQEVEVERGSGTLDRLLQGALGW
ncbi:MAG: tetraacyldisaccharide 4'-kinase [Longimicrobiaceae bacterium]